MTPLAFVFRTIATSRIACAVGDDKSDSVAGDDDEDSDGGEENGEDENVAPTEPSGSSVECNRKDLFR